MRVARLADRASRLLRGRRTAGSGGVPLGSDLGRDIPLRRSGDGPQAPRGGLPRPRFGHGRDVPHGKASGRGNGAAGARRHAAHRSRRERAASAVGPRDARRLPVDPGEAHRAAPRERRTLAPSRDLPRGRRAVRGRQLRPQRLVAAAVPRGGVSRGAGRPRRACGEDARGPGGARPGRRVDGDRHLRLGRRLRLRGAGRRAPGDRPLPDAVHGPGRAQGRAVDRLRLRPRPTRARGAAGDDHQLRRPPQRRRDDRGP